MVSVSKLIPIGMIGVSLLIGLTTLYVFNDQSKQVRKEHIVWIVSQFVNFVIYIWIGKILVNVSMFIEDPLAVLAYPSSSHAFYIAVFVTMVSHVVRRKSKAVDVLRSIESLILVFLIMSFMYEFLQLVWNNNPFSFGYLVLTSTLLVLFILLRERTDVHTLIVMIIAIWSVGMLLLAFSYPFVTVFGYIMTPWFVCVFYLVSTSILITQNKRRELNDRN